MVREVVVCVRWYIAIKFSSKITIQCIWLDVRCGGLVGRTIRKADLLITMFSSHTPTNRSNLKFNGLDRHNRCTRNQSAGIYFPQIDILI